MITLDQCFSKYGHRPLADLRENSRGLKWQQILLLKKIHLPLSCAGCCIDGAKTVEKLFGLSINQGTVRKLYYHCIYHCIPYSTHSETINKQYTTTSK